jgi:hypothetical protein
LNLYHDWNITDTTREKKQKDAQSITKKLIFLCLSFGSIFIKNIYGMNISGGEIEKIINKSRLLNNQTYSDNELEQYMVIMENETQLH